jgi:hypothetical protein
MYFYSLYLQYLFITENYHGNIFFIHAHSLLAAAMGGLMLRRRRSTVRK